MAPPTPRRRPKVQHILAYLFVPVVLYFWWQSIRTLNLTESLAQTQGREGWLLAALGFAGLYLVGQAVVWRQLVVELVTPIPWGIALRTWMLSNMGRYLPGSVWHLVGRVMIGEAAGVQKSSGALGVVLEQALQLLSALLIVGASLPFWQSDSIVGQYAWVAWFVPLGLIAIHPRLFFPILNTALRKIGRAPLPDTLSYISLLRYTLYYCGVHLCNGLALLAVVVALGQPLSTAPVVLGAALFAWTLGYLMILAPGGLGVREWLVTEALAPVMGRDVAAVAALLWRAANILTEAMGAALFGLLVRPIPMQQKKAAV
jgi:hypothetical protein